MNASETGFVDVALPPDPPCGGERDRSDEVLIQEIVQRQPDALCLLYARYEGLVVAVARRVLLDLDDAQETLQDVFLLIWNYPERFDARRGKVKGWICRLTHCRAIDRYRKRRREATTREALREEIARHATERFYQYDRAKYISDVGDDGRAVLLESMACLSSEQMQALLLTYVMGMSQREIASHLGITLGMVKHRLKKAMGSMVKTSDRLRGIFAV